ncbi:hypothetical protein TPHA_0A05190 [Tetrapisispora phaffii CBS 4417]|uniref:PEX18/PEX21 C-terminal domain-containing protein n=1 Tax=Tetrapisispora phaffii (strain ATCC 24235 / CBS 4417 / NBRC 1672 / NRRL Y-8282 / UCD 70-5) TaxID=1071381 RepID=G8BNW6_TETPH|nr:hypothetical protein TPHA_0A05190 [Tetrapisispora phaffii CBS 4417]CCE61594.1 hypothetical protein TPHA_0A05190 [Tetrapisispora phaffii CBS 4417]
MMASFCQVNPLQQLVTKNDGENSQWFNIQNKNGSQSISASRAVHDNIERNFINKNDQEYLIGNNINDNLPEAGSRGYRLHNEINTNSFVEEFSKVQVQDHMEFSDTYKKLYDKYENYQKDSQYSYNASPLHGFNERQNLHGQAELFNGQTFNQSYNRNEMVEISALESQFNEQFDKLENELHLTEEEDQVEKSILEEEITFRNTASELINTVSNSINENSTIMTNEMLSSKIANSKFFNMMNNVNNGKMALNANKYEFISKETGETVGNKYSMVADKVNDHQNK